MRQRQDEEESQARAARRRRNLEAAGVRRIDVLVPSEDAALVRELAARLRAGGEEAEHLRRALAPRRRPKPQWKTGQDVVDFFLRSPLAGSGIDLARDQSTKPPIDL